MKKPIKLSLPAGSTVLKILSFVAIAVLCVLFFLLVRQLNNLSRSAKEVSRTAETRNALWLTLNKLKDAEAKQNGFLLTHDSSFFQEAAKRNQQMEQHLSALRAQIAENPLQRQRLDTLESLIVQRLQLLDTVALHNPPAGQHNTLHEEILRAKSLMQSVEAQIRNMDSTEVQVLQQHTADNNRFVMTTPRLAAFLVLAALFIILLAFFQQRQLLQLARTYLQKSLDAREEVSKNNLLLEHAEQINNAGSLEWNHAQDKAVFSANFYRLLGRSASSGAFTMDDFFSAMDEDDRNGFLQAMEPCLQNGRETFSNRFWTTGRNGERKHFQCNGRVKKEDGETIVTATIHDITEEEILKQQLQQRKDLIESIVENSSDLVAVIDTSRRYTVWNKANEQQFGLTKNNVIGRVIEEVFPFIKNDERLHYINEGLKGKAAYVKELPYYHGQKTAEFSYIPLTNTEGVVIGLLIMAHDITERKRAAEELQMANDELKNKNTELEKAIGFNRLVTDLAPNNILVIDIAKGTPVFLNRQAKEMFGGEMEESTGNVLQHVIHPDDLPAELEKLKCLQVAGDADIIESECRVKNHRSEYRLVHLWRAVFKRNARNEVEQYISISIDITDIKKTEKELAEKNRDLQLVNDEISSFNYIASHDLQEPMRKVQIFANLLEESENGLAPQSRMYLQRIQASAGRMRHLINDLLSFSQINILDGALKPVDLNDVLAEAIFALKSAVDEKGGRITSDGLPVVQGNAFQLQQLFENIIGNAVKYSKADLSPVVMVTAKKVTGEQTGFSGLEKSQSYHHLRFADNGIGFKPEYGTKIFEMFERLHHLQEYSGTGLGLAICKKVVQNHRGYISATGNPGQGAVVDVFLPTNS